MKIRRLDVGDEFKIAYFLGMRALRRIGHSNNKILKDIFKKHPFYRGTGQ